MNLKQVKQVFFENIQSFTEVHGFSIKKTSFDLVKKEQNKTIEISFTHNDYYDEIELIPTLKIYLDEVAPLMKTCWSRKVPTLSINLIALEAFYEKGEKYIEDYTIEGKDRFHLFNDNDTLDTIKQLSYYYEAYALKYIDDYANLEVINETFNKKPNKITYHHSSWGYQSSVGIIVAKLLQSKKYEKLAQTYYKEYKKNEDWNIEKFECIVNTLNQR